MVVNDEIKTYQEISQKVKLSKVWDLLKATPHSGQRPIVDTFDNDDSINCYVVILGRRSGKSFSTAVIVLRELLIPHSNTILLSPSYKNSNIMFSEVLKHVMKLKLPVKAINKNQFTIELDNGAKFSSVTQTNYESALGSRLSLLVVDESASVQGLKSIYEEILGPMLLDYSTKPNGTLYAKVVMIGTPKGKGSELHSFYLKELTARNWKSFHSPSTCNPLLPAAYLAQQKELLPENVYRQELLAEWLDQGQGVFFEFNQQVNLYDPEEITFGDDAFYVTAHDFGFTDNTAMVLVYITRRGEYYVHDAYQANAKPTKEHVDNFKKLERRSKGTCEARYYDPSAVQLAMDIRTQYNYDMDKANNKVAPGLACINTLMAVQGYDKKPKLFINKKLTELIRQIQSVTYKDSKSTSDPFNKDTETSHWDLLAALRYAVYTHYRREQAGLTVV
jgi:hypothetical protein